MKNFTNYSYMEQSPWEANCCSASQEIWTWKFIMFTRAHCWSLSQTLFC